MSRAASGGRSLPAPRTAVVAFAAVIIATALAFAFAQRLKRAPPLAYDTHHIPLLAPNGDTHWEETRFSFKLRRSDTATILVTTPAGDVVRTLRSDFPITAYKQVKGSWNGSDDRGRLVPDGRYRIMVALQQAGRSIQLPFTITKDTVAPEPKLLSIGPEQTGQGPTRPELLPRTDGEPITVRFRVTGRDPGVAVFRTDLATPRKVLAERLPEGASTWTWDGTADGRRVAQGTYVVGIHARDKAYNVGWSFGGPEPVAAFGEQLQGQGGVTVRYLAAQSPQIAIDAGSRAEIGVISPGRQYNWNIRRIGEQRARSRGKSRQPIVRPRMPRGPSGLHVFSVRNAEGRTAQSAILTQGSTDSPVLVVVPQTSLVGAMRVDDDGDGAPDTLDRGVTVETGRVPVSPELPSQLTEQIAPLLIALDRRKRRYDLTTDLALARGTGPELRGHKGVILAGRAEFVDANVQRRLVTWVERGGRLWIAEPGSLRRSVEVTAGQARNPTTLSPRDPFGFELGEPQVAERVLAASERSGLFAGTDGSFEGPFTVEPVVTTPAGARRLDEASTIGGQTVLASVRIDRGTVVRSGIEGLGARATRDADAREFLRNMWAFLRGDD